VPLVKLRGELPRNRSVNMSE